MLLLLQAVCHATTLASAEGIPAILRYKMLYISPEETNTYQNVGARTM